MITTDSMFTIDTLLFSKKLEKAGMKKETAEVLAEEIKEIQSRSSGAMATKGDLAHLESSMRHEIKIAMLTTIISLGAIMALIEKFIN
jgi:hypothetical protein